MRCIRCGEDLKRSAFVEIEEFLTELKNKYPDLDYFYEGSDCGTFVMEVFLEDMQCTIPEQTRINNQIRCPKCGAPLFLTHDALHCSNSCCAFACPKHN